MNSAIVRLKIPIISMCNSADRVNTNLVRAIALQMFCKGFSAGQSAENRWVREIRTMLKGLGVGIPTNVGIMAVQ